MAGGDILWVVTTWVGPRSSMAIDMLSLSHASLRLFACETFKAWQKPSCLHAMCIH